MYSLQDLHNRVWHNKYTSEEIFILYLEYEIIFIIYLLQNLKQKILIFCIYLSLSLFI